MVVAQAKEVADGGDEHQHAAEEVKAHVALDLDLVVGAALEFVLGLLAGAHARVAVPRMVVVVIVVMPVVVVRHPPRSIK